MERTRREEEWRQTDKLKNKWTNRGQEKRRKKRTRRVSAERRCVGFISAETFDFSSQGERRFGELWWCFLR